MTFQNYLSETANALDQEVQVILDEWLMEVEKISPKLVSLSQAFIKACQGGKRIRGMLVKLGYEMTQGVILTSSEARGKDLSRMRDSNKLRDSSPSAQNDIVKVGAAYEIFHASILAHDDIADKSSLRRGQPTLYKALGGDHHGVSQTIFLADIGFFLAIKTISEGHFDEANKNKALDWFAKTMIDTGLGQMLDVEVPHLGGKRKEEDVIKIMHLKTAQYTVSGPLILGAILAGAGQDLVEVLGEFGERLGIAFQIQDDILGVFGDEKELGKSVTSDIEEGKNTLLITEALKRANPAQREILGKFYGQGIVGISGLRAVRKVFLQTSSLDYSRQMGVKYVIKSKSIIPKITNDKIMISILTEMADFLVERSY